MKFKEMNLPNKLTTIRMWLVPVVIILFALFILNKNGIFTCDLVLVKAKEHQVGNVIYYESLTLNQILIALFFIGASFTDFLDGHIARKNHIVSDYGKIMDPLADKLLVNSTLILLGFSGMYLINNNIPNAFNVFVMIMVVFSIARDFFVDALKTQALKKNVVVAATIYGKLKTATLIVGISFMILGSVSFVIYYIGLFLVLLGSVFSIIGGIDYWFNLKDHLGE